MSCAMLIADRFNLPYGITSAFIIEPRQREVRCCNLAISQRPQSNAAKMLSLIGVAPKQTMLDLLHTAHPISAMLNKFSHFKPRS